MDGGMWKVGSDATHRGVPIWSRGNRRDPNRSSERRTSKLADRRDP